MVNVLNDKIDIMSFIIYCVMFCLLIYNVDIALGVSFFFNMLGKSNPISSLVVLRCVFLQVSD